MRNTRTGDRMAAATKCDICEGQVPFSRKGDHFRKIYPEYAFVRKAGSIWCACGEQVNTYKGLVKHYQDAHGRGVEKARPDTATLRHQLAEHETPEKSLFVSMVGAFREKNDEIERLRALLAVRDEEITAQAAEFAALREEVTTLQGQVLSLQAEADNAAAERIDELERALGADK